MDIQSLLLVSLMMISNTDHNEGALDWQHLHHRLVRDIVLLGGEKFERIINKDHLHTERSNTYHRSKLQLVTVPGGTKI